MEKSLTVRVAPTNALHIHIRTAGRVTFEEVGGALVTAEGVDMPDQQPVRETALPSARQVIDLVARECCGESSVVAALGSELGSN